VLRSKTPHESTACCLTLRVLSLGYATAFVACAPSTGISKKVSTRCARNSESRTKPRTSPTSAIVSPWCVTGLRYQRARESDLIYEAYYEAFRIDLGKDEGTLAP